MTCVARCGSPAPRKTSRCPTRSSSRTNPGHVRDQARQEEAAPSGAASSCPRMCSPPPFEASRRYHRTGYPSRTHGLSMADLSLTLGPGRKQELLLRNPVMTASGTFSNGLEFAKRFDVDALG